MNLNRYHFFALFVLYCVHFKDQESLWTQSKTPKWLFYILQFVFLKWFQMCTREHHFPFYILLLCLDVCKMLSCNGNNVQHCFSTKNHGNKQQMSIKMKFSAYTSFFVVVAAAAAAAAMKLWTKNKQQSQESVCKTQVRFCFLFFFLFERKKCARNIYKWSAKWSFFLLFFFIWSELMKWRVIH